MKRLEKTLPIPQRYPFSKMKTTGIVRRVDELGRIVIPIGLRQTHEMEAKQQLEIFVEGEYIILGKYSPHCYLCGDTNNLRNFKGKNICQPCINDL